MPIQNQQRLSINGNPSFRRGNEYLFFSHSEERALILPLSYKEEVAIRPSGSFKIHSSLFYAS